MLRGQRGRQDGEAGTARHSQTPCTCPCLTRACQYVFTVVVVLSFVAESVCHQALFDMDRWISVYCE